MKKRILASKFIVWFAAHLFCLLSYGKLFAIEFSKGVGSFGFYGGQYFFKGSPGTLSGNISADFSPTVKFSPRTAGILTLNAAYRGSKEVSELAGGGTLFQDAASLGAMFKVISAELTSKLKIRPSVSYRRELLRETVDENWTRGLFDYDKVSWGVEAEYEFSKNHSLAVGGDYFQIKFPNYRSLESQQVANDLGREQQGSRTLDSDNILAAVRSSHSFFDRRLKVDVSCSQLTKNYPDQPLAVSLDALSPTEKRKDVVVFASFYGSYPLLRPTENRALGVITAIGYSWISNDSSQNRVDATRGVFIKDYYDYVQTIPSVSLNLLFGRKPFVLSCIGSLSSKNYSTRPVQDVSGAYESDKIYINEQTFTIKAIYPVADKLKAIVSSSYLQSSSNMKYESVYRYNYDSATYFAGVLCEF